MTADLPLAGVRVLDRTSRLAGAYATKLLRDVGADVVVAETAKSPHPLRAWSAGLGIVDGDGPLFRWLAAGKRSVDLDEVPDLLDRADVVVVDDVEPPQPRAGAVAVSITDFGVSGPWARRPASHLVLEAESGSLGSRGVPEHPPVAVGGALGEWIAGLYAGVAALAAWRSARESGSGESVDVSVFECMLVTLNMHEPLHAALAGTDAFTRWVQVPSIERAKDGWVCFSLVTGQQWLDFAAMIERPDLGADPALSNMLGRWPRREEIYAAMQPWLTARTVEEVVEVATAFRLPVAHVSDGASIAAMEHFRVREVFSASPYGEYPQPRPPWRFSRATTAPVAAAPDAGADTDAVAADWRAARDPAAPRDPAAARDTVAARDTAAARDPAAPRPPRRPLDGVRVVDLTAFWAGPSGTGYLAALGADVVKVESVQRPDGMRFAGGQITRADGWWEHSWVFQGCNAGKRGITLDLTSEAGRDLLHRLLASADVLTENFSPRVMAQFGLSYDALAARYPRLVVVRMPAFGLDGPWADRVGFALTMEALAGMATITGHPEGRPTCPGGVLDPIAGLHAAFATIVAIEHRVRTGAGQLVEVPMIECALNVAAEPLLEWGAHQVRLDRRGNKGVGVALQDVYPAAGDDAWVAVTLRDDADLAAAAAAVGRDDADLAAVPTAAAAAAAGATRDAATTGGLDAALRAFVAGRDPDDAVQRLVAAGVPAGVVRRPTVAAANPQVRTRGFYETHEHPTLGAFDYPVVPTRFSSWRPPVYSRPAPTLGQHNREVLGAELGLPDDELARLEREGVIGTRPAGL